MSTVLVDTNILLRLANPESDEHTISRVAVLKLRAQGVELALPIQVLVEFWVVATRPTTVNGLGWSVEQAHQSIDAFRTHFTILQETPDTLDRWIDLVTRAGIAGKRAHDARIAAVMLTAGVSELLTLNTDDFVGMPGITPLHPSKVAD
jgi:predicted nucleic acid-binding protein